MLLFCLNAIYIYYFIYTITSIYYIPKYLFDLKQFRPINNSRKFIVTIPARKEFLLNQAKDFFRCGTVAIMTGCSS